MSEQDDPPPPPPPDTPPLPVTYSIPTQLLEKWITIPSGNYLEVKLTKGDIELLFFAVLRSIEGQKNLQEAIIRWSHNDLENANKVLDTAKRQQIEGENLIRQFLAAVIAGSKAL